MSTFCKHCQINSNIVLGLIITLFILSNAWIVRSADLFAEPKPVIVIDPGHGGHDTGVKGPDGSLEKNISLALALLLKTELSEKFTPILTRTDDYDLEIQDRTATANQKNASVFISIHSGGSFQHKTSGISTYYFQKPSSADFSSVQPDSDSLSEAVRLWSDVQLSHITESKALAQALHESMSGRVDLEVKNRQGGNFFILAGADMPAIIIETGHLTNPSDESKLNDINILKHISHRISQGIENFLSK